MRHLLLRSHFPRATGEEGPLRGDEVRLGVPKQQGVQIHPPRRAVPAGGTIRHPPPKPDAHPRSQHTHQTRRGPLASLFCWRNGGTNGAEDILTSADPVREHHQDGEKEETLPLLLIWSACMHINAGVLVDAMDGMGWHYVYRCVWHKITLIFLLPRAPQYIINNIL
jgi:hypothetical protein